MTAINSRLITLDPVSYPGKDIIVDVLRLDKIHPVISGNKWYKLRFYLKQAIEQHKKTICTFGGAWSNHIVATAAACAENGLQSIGIIRGEKPVVLSNTLQEAIGYGMQLYFTSREDFRNKKIPFDNSHESIFTVPEGGFGVPGAEGASTILELVQPGNYTDIFCACGTGTMLAGLAMAAAPQTRVTGISVLKNHTGLEKDTRSLMGTSKKDFTVMHDFHQGGYAKKTEALIDFMNRFYSQTGIPSDFVYTGKLFYALDQLLAEGYFAPHSRILAIHSGGLQGNSSLENGTLIF